MNAKIYGKGVFFVYGRLFLFFVGRKDNIHFLDEKNRKLLLFVGRFCWFPSSILEMNSFFEEIVSRKLKTISPKKEFISWTSHIVG